MSDENVVRALRKPNPPRLCIFCGGTPISKEHIYADWMKEHLPSFFTETKHTVTYRFRDELGEVNETESLGPLNLKGDHRGKGLKIVCQTCNNGWMSILQTKARLTLEPLIKSHWPVTHNRQQQKILTAWAVMFTMVYDQADTKTSAISSHQRLSFSRTQNIPKNWAVWVARFDGFRQQAGTRHRGILYNLTGTKVQYTAHPKCNVQFTVGAAGNFFFLTFHSSDKDVFEMMYGYLRTLAVEIELYRVFPTTSFKPKIGVIDDDAFENIIPFICNRIYSGQSVKW